MSNELTNLLPPSRQSSLAHEYYFRVGVVAIALVVILIGAAATLLIPTYVFLVGNEHAKEMRLANLKATPSSADEVALAARLSALSNESATITSLANMPSASKIVRAALTIPRSGITLSSFTYTPHTSAKSNGSLLLSGTAPTRELLRNYQLALQNASFAQSAELPVSAYAKDADIAFTITITLAP
jgi:hypothetical protein